MDIISQLTLIQKLIFVKLQQTEDIGKDGKWIETEPMEIKQVYDFPEIGQKDMYLLYHEELESFAINITGIKTNSFLDDIWRKLFNTS